MSTQAPTGLDACTRCGLCLQACPTYRELKVEADSPRGRIFLMKRVADGEAPIDAGLAEHLYVCLGCRACETACPSGVPFGQLLEQGRAAVEQAGTIDPSRTGWRWFRRIAFEWILPHRSLFAAAMAPARWLQRWPVLAAFARALPLPRRLRTMIEMIPPRPPASSDLETVQAPDDAGARVSVFAGCLMGSLFPHVHEALARVLRRNGCAVVECRGQWCCGALNVHAGEQERAKQMACRNIDAFDASAIDAIVVDSAGCGAALKEYGALLADDPAYAQRAEAFARKVKDASEFLAALPARGGLRSVRRRVTLQDACHLAHAQRIRRQPRELLRSVPGLELVDMAGSDRCCGAAGVYSLTHPDLSDALIEERFASADATGADTIVVTNPGCHMQWIRAVRRHKSRMQVRHLVEILDEAYSAER